MACALMIIGLVSCTSSGDTADSATVTPESLETAQRAAATMLRALAVGDYRTAYEMRTARCNQMSSFDDYIATAHREYGAHDLLAENPEIVVLAESTELAQIAIVFENQSADQATSRRWVYRDNRWQFDNC